MGVTLTVTAKGRITLKKDVLEHLGVKAGDKLAVELAGPGKVQIVAMPQGAKKDISRLFGVIDGSGQSVSIEEMNASVAISPIG